MMIILISLYHNRNISFTIIIDHLFCEDELLEWMSRFDINQSLCPITKNVLDPTMIRKPSRIIINMLNELEMYCSNKCNGERYLIYYINVYFIVNI